MFLLASSLFGSPAAEERPALNGEWVLCVTAFDVSDLPPARRIVGDVVARNLVYSLSGVERRAREPGESDWYRDYARNLGVAEAARVLAVKREERDALIYRGDPVWKYRQNIKAADREIVNLEKVLREAMEDEPLIVEEPVFSLVQDNLDGIFPQPPEEGKEYFFCREKKADAVLAGSVTEYYGRVYVSLRLYTIYRNSWVYEDSVIFSTEDLDDASDELAGRLAVVVSGTNPAFVAVHAAPEHTTVVINDSFAGRGEVPVREHPPGTITVIVSAEDHRTQRVETELEAGERTDISVSLMPLDLSSVYVDVPGKAGVLVYRGAFFEGEAPLSLSLPRGMPQYIRVESPDGETGSLVFMNSESFFGSNSGSSPVQYGFSIKTARPDPPGLHRVEDARRKYYAAWGRLWIILPAVFFFSGLADARIEGWNSSSLTDQGYHASVMRYDALRWGAWAAVGLAGVDVIFNIWRYMRAANAGSVYVVK
jgi:hypothetical protein